jgi:hypothetical protein
VRSQRTRKKKLIVAFHFQAATVERGGRTGWDCENCRRNGLERKRRCGFLPAELRGEPRIVWGRRQMRIEECPKSFITAESLAAIEEYFVTRQLGIPDSLDTEARKVDAFLLLKDLIVKEERDVTSQY